ncbi:MAG: Histidyl-tRNA synthetase [Pseudolabrys sp.]|jgi:histidyl-tRNA synthetase|nr:Histidyl-tRNA synthetase [Pseudolabrys sp.]
MTDKKPNKLKARLPRGLADRGPAEIAATREMVETIRQTFERYGFEPVETPAIEYTDALGKFLPDQDRPNEGVFSFQDDDEQWLSLRYDLTAPLARYVAERIGTEHIVLPYRSYRAGYVFRNEKPGPGRFRQFMQFDADTVGSASMAADAEMCMLAADTMEALGIPRGSYVVKVNNRKVLDGVMEAIGLGGEENAGRRLTVLRAIDKADKFPIQEIRKLLGEGRWDGGEVGKGDFTKGAFLTSGEIDTILAFLQTGVAAQTKAIRDTARASLRSSLFSDIDDLDDDDLSDLEVGPLQLRAGNRPRDTFAALANQEIDNKAFVEGVEELKAISDLVRRSGFGTKRIKIDTSVVRGLEYYTGPVFEVELTFEINDEKGRPVRFGSVGGGGRYDGLVSRFRGETVPATGFSIGVSRLQAALSLIGKLGDNKVQGPVVVTVFDKDRIADYQAMVTQLRNAPINAEKPEGPKIRAELYLGNPKNLGNQLKYADKRNAPCVIIQGGNEKAKGEVTIKDLTLGAALAAQEKGRDEYLQKQTQAQRTVPQADLVKEVQTILARRS